MRSPVRFENKNNAERIGWNEIVVADGTSGINISTAPHFGSAETTNSTRIRRYPLTVPLAERTRKFLYRRAACSGQNRCKTATASAARR
jgi:hypothetical protein